MYLRYSRHESEFLIDLFSEEAITCVQQLFQYYRMMLIMFGFGGG